jgi:hypothetical protein
MKKILLFMALAAAIVSCKKSSSGSGSYHMTATIDNKPKNFNAVAPVASKLMNGDVLSDLSITGVLNTTTGESIILEINNGMTDQPIIPGTYSDTSTSFQIQAIYAASVATQYYGGTAITEEAANSGYPVKNHVKIVITSIDSKAVKGSFSGDIYAGDFTAPTPMINGDFYAAFGN